MASILISFLVSLAVRKPVVWGGPLTLSIEPTNHCNLKCPECPSGAGMLTRPMGLLKLSDFCRIIDQIRDHCFYIQLYFQGEPFINKNLAEMVAYARNNRIYTSISTNGLLLNDEKIDIILSSPPDKIIFSIDGLDQESYEKYRVGGICSDAISSLRNLVKKRNSKGMMLPFVEWQFIVMRDNEHQIESVRRMCREIGVNKLTLKTMQVTSYENADKFLPLNEKYRRYKLKEGKIELKSRLHNHCFALWRTSVITWDGKIAPCCFDKDTKYSPGNLKQESFISIWHSADYNQFRQRILSQRRSVDICTNCTEGLRINISNY